MGKKIQTTKPKNAKPDKNHKKEIVIPVASQHNPYHVLSPGTKAPEELNVYIECPMRSKIKYELDKQSGFLTISRILHSSVHYPSNYGFIPQTYCGDRDPLDVLVLSHESVTPGCVMKARPVGMLRMLDQGLEDIKIIAVHVNDPMSVNYTDISQLPPHVLREIHHFFEIYKELEKDKNPMVGDFQGRIDAFQAIRESMVAYELHKYQLLKGEYPDC